MSEIINNVESERQKFANINGANYELHVKDSLNSKHELKLNNIRILDGNESLTDVYLRKLFDLQIRPYRGNDSDLYLVAQNLETKNPIALISCSLSLHARLPQTLFYSLVYKTKNPNLKVVFTTPDKGREKSGSDLIRLSEWGSDHDPTKGRSLAEKYLDGVYIDSQYLNTVCGFQGTTKIEGILKPFSELTNDLIRWKMNNQ